MTEQKRLREWTGWRDVVSAFENSGYGQIGELARIASELCPRISVEDFQREQMEQGKRYVNSLFGERIPFERGSLRSQLQQALVQMSEGDRLAKFGLRLYRAREAEMTEADDGFVVNTTTEIRKYVERSAVDLGYALRLGLRGRRLTKSFGSLRAALSFDNAPSRTREPTALELHFWIEIGESNPPIDAPVDSGSVAEGTIYYDLITQPRDLRLPPPPRDVPAISRMAKHGVRAKLRFIDLLTTSLASTVVAP